MERKNNKQITQAQSEQEIAKEFDSNIIFSNET